MNWVIDFLGAAPTLPIINRLEASKANLGGSKASSEASKAARNAKLKVVKTSLMNCRCRTPSRAATKPIELIDFSTHFRMFPRETPDYRRIDQLTVRANYSFQLIHCYIVDRVHDGMYIAAYFLTKPNDSFTFFKALFDCSEIERINFPLFAIIEIIGYKRRNEFLFNFNFRCFSRHGFCKCR